MKGKKARTRSRLQNRGRLLFQNGEAKGRRRGCERERRVGGKGGSNGRLRGDLDSVLKKSDDLYRERIWDCLL